MTTRETLLKIGEKNGWREAPGTVGATWVLDLHRDGVSIWVEFGTTGRVDYAEYNGGFAQPQHRITGGAAAVTRYLKGIT